MTIAQQNIHFLGQGLDLLERLDDTLFATPGRLGGKAGAGAHLRHCIDYYRCFLRGLDDGRVDYDERERDPRLETEPAAAAAALRELADRLAELSPAAAHQPLQVRVDAAAWEDPEASWSTSSVQRELQFLLSHTVHHYALIALVLRSLGFDPGPDFGVAPSTLEHRTAVAVCAR